MVFKGSKDDSKGIKMKQYKYQINGNRYEVSVETPAADGTIAVTVNGETYSVVREPEPVVEKKKVVVKPVAAKPTTGTDEMQDALRSPLPGTVVEILAKTGQQVKEGETLIVLEAMKMNNNLTAEHDGIVKSILIEEGEAVKENTPLVTFE
jgi:biotin carboxyl carrier protein